MLDKVSTCGNLLHIVSHWEDLGGGGGGVGIEYFQLQNTPPPPQKIEI